MKDPKYLPNCVEIMSIIHDTIKSFYHDAQRGISVQPVLVSFFPLFIVIHVTFDSDLVNMFKTIHTNCVRKVFRMMF